MIAKNGIFTTSYTQKKIVSQVLKITTGVDGCDFTLRYNFWCVRCGENTIFCYHLLNLLLSCRYPMLIMLICYPFQAVPFYLQANLVLSLALLTCYKGKFDLTLSYLLLFSTFFRLFNPYLGYPHALIQLSSFHPTAFLISYSYIHVIICSSYSYPNLSHSYPLFILQPSYSYHHAILQLSSVHLIAILMLLSVHFKVSYSYHIAILCSSYNYPHAFLQLSSFYPKATFC